MLGFNLFEWENMFDLSVVKLVIQREALMGRGGGGGGGGGG